MFINVRVRPERDDDIAKWYDAQEDKSQAVRDAIRDHIERQRGGSQDELLEQLPALVARAVARGLERLPAMVQRAVTEALADYEVAGKARGDGAGGDVDVALAKRLDEQLNEFFG